MNATLQKLYRGSTEKVIEDMLKHYGYHGTAVVNFLYFANAIKYHLLEDLQEQIDFDYFDALMQGDFLLPDGIALQVRDKFANKKAEKTYNLNGTDLTPAFLEYVARNYDVELYVVSVYDEKIGKWPERLDIGVEKMREKYGIQRIYSYQTQYADRGNDYPFESRAQGEKSETTIRLMLHCTGTPFQELFTKKHMDWYKEKNILVMNVWWFIDFVSWFETRAPERVVKARVLETFWRVATNPKKNVKKFLTMFGVFRLLWKNIRKKMQKLFWKK